MIKVDTLAAARTTRAEMAQLWAYIQKTIQPDDQVLSVIAFRGENRSEAQYVASASAARSEGTGIVQQLSLMVGWDRGTFAGFTWFNQGPCDMCGGLGNARCVQTQYDANYQKYPESACACERLRGPLLPGPSKGRRPRSGPVCYSWRTRQAPTRPPAPPWPAHPSRVV